MIALVFVALVAVLVGAVADLRRVRRVPLFRRKMCWWNVVPVEPEEDVKAAAMAVARLKGRWWFRAWATVVRLGRDDVDSDIWLGVLGVKQPEAVVDALAQAAGCKLGEPGPPPPLEGRTRWWWSEPEESTGTSLEEGDVDLLSRIGREDQIVGWVERFAPASDKYSSEGDALVVTFSPTAERGQQMMARAACTQWDMGASWSHPGPDSPRHVWPSYWVGVTSVGGLLSAGLLAASFGVLGASAQSGASWAAVLLAGVTLLLAAFVTARGVFSPRASRVLSETYRLPIRSGLAKRLESVDARLAAGWLSGGEQTSTAARERLAPARLTEMDGIPLGNDGSERIVWLRDKERQNGFIVFGDAGSGKTTLLLKAFKGDIESLMNGERRSIFWLETKGAGAERAANVARSVGYEPCVINVAERTGPRLELVDWSQPRRSAELMAAAAKYAFDRGWIEGRSEAVLTSVFRAVVGANPQVAKACGYDKSYPNLLRMAYLLLGGERSQGGMQAARAALRDYQNEDSVDFMGHLDPHVTKTESDRRMEAACGKLQLLMPGEALFDVDLNPDRGQVSLPMLLGGPPHGVAGHPERYHVTIINLSSDRGMEGGYTETTAQRLASIIFFCLWDSIERHCHEWQSAGRSVAIYSDELSDIAGLGAGDVDVIRDMVHQGRSYGVQLMLGTQQFDQIPPRAMSALESFGSSAFFHAESPKVAEFAERILAGEYSAAEIRSLPPYVCATRLRYGGVAESAFTLYPENVG